MTASKSSEPRTGEASGVFDVAVAGGGPVGATLALAFAAGGRRVVILDPPARREAAAKAYFVAAGCWRIWRRLGLASRLEAAGEPIHEVSADGERLAGVRFDDAALAGEPLGWMIEHDPLMAGLAGALAAFPLIERACGEATGMNAGGASARLDWRAADGGAGGAAARLVAACDGARSVLREAAGIRFEGRDYPALALSLFVRLDRPVPSSARQIFLPTGPLAVLALPGGRANIVWTHRTPAAHALAAMADGDLARELARAAGDFIGSFQIEAGRRGAFPLRLRLAGSWTAPRLALAGDAAHLVHPLAGQGLNLGLKDAATLVDVVGEAERLGLDPGSETALLPYTQRRRADATGLAAAMEGFARVFSGPAPVRAAAAALMAGTGLAPGLASLFVREAAAVSGDPPELMRAG